MQKCLTYISEIQNLIEFAKYMEEIKEYQHLITAGNRIIHISYFSILIWWHEDIEELLEGMRQKQEKFEEKQVELKKLEQKFLQQKDEGT